MLVWPQQIVGVGALDLWPALIVVGVAAVCGQLLMTHAYKLDKAAPIAAASYAGPLWAYLMDYLLFDVTPSALGLVGGLLVLTAGGVVIFGARSSPTAADALDASEAQSE
jgi:drug/metabolite transporter (DMT)-like permease